MTVAKVAGGAVAAGGTTGAVGYGTYRYLTYETLRDLIEKEKTTGDNLVLLKASDDETIWNKAADNYLVSLTESEESSFANKIDDKITAISSEDTDLRNKRTDFKKWCLEVLDSEATEENRANKDKVKAWCIKFESYGEHDNKELDLNAQSNQWAPKYTALTATDGKVKVLLVAKKGSEDTDDKKSEAAKWWCQLAINKKFDDNKYQDFQSKCLLKTKSS